MEALSIQHPVHVGTEPFDIADVRVSLKSLMGRLVGVERDADGLREAADSIRSFAAYVMPHQFDSIEGWELQNMLISASCVVDAALVRVESRGVHFRSDYPEPDDEKWRRHLTIQIDADGGHPKLGEMLGPVAPIEATFTAER
jgi:L-aspartate oxidase